MNNTERLIGKMNDELAAFVAGLERLCPSRFRGQ